jgi:hypothetical protein
MLKCSTVRCYALCLTVEWFLNCFHSILFATRYVTDHLTRWVTCLPCFLTLREWKLCLSALFFKECILSCVYHCIYVSELVYLPNTTHSLTHSWSWALLEKPPIVQPLKNFPAFYGTRRFITAFTRALHWPLSWAKSIQSIPSHPRSILILSTHLRLGLPSGSFLLDFTPIFYIHSSSPPFVPHALLISSSLTSSF